MLLIVRFYDESLSVRHRLPDPTSLAYPERPDDNTILSLKNTIELTIGLPIELQIISFVDALDLPNHKLLREFGIKNNSRIDLTIKSEIDYRGIFLAARHGDLTVLRENKILTLPGTRDNDKYSQPKRHILSVERTKTIEKSWSGQANCHHDQPDLDDGSPQESRYTSPRPLETFDALTTRRLSCLCPEYGYTPRKSVAEQVVFPAARSSMSSENFLQLSQHAFQSKKNPSQLEIILSQSKSKISMDENPKIPTISFEVPEIPICIPKPQKLSAYQRANNKNLEVYRSYRIFICMLGAIANNQKTLLIQLYNAHTEVFLHCHSKISQRTILHVACSVSTRGLVPDLENSCLMTILYKFKGAFWVRLAGIKKITLEFELPRHKPET